MLGAWLVGLWAWSAFPSLCVADHMSVCWTDACSSSGVCSTGLVTGPLRRSIRWVKSSPARWTWRSPTTKCRTTCPPSTTSCRSFRATARLSSTAVCSCIRRCTRSESGSATVNHDLDSNTHTIWFLNDSDSLSIKPEHSNLFIPVTRNSFTNSIIPVLQSYYHRDTGMNVYSSDINSDVCGRDQNRANHHQITFVSIALFLH